MQEACFSSPFPQLLETATTAISRVLPDLRTPGNLDLPDVTARTGAAGPAQAAAAAPAAGAPTTAEPASNPPAEAPAVADVQVLNAGVAPSEAASGAGLPHAAAWHFPAIAAAVAALCLAR